MVLCSGRERSQLRKGWAVAAPVPPSTLPQPRQQVHHAPLPFGVSHSQTHTHHSRKVSGRLSASGSNPNLHHSPTNLPGRSTRDITYRLEDIHYVSVRYILRGHVHQVCCQVPRYLLLIVHSSLLHSWCWFLANLIK